VVKFKIVVFWFRLEEDTHKTLSLYSMILQKNFKCITATLSSHFIFLVNFFTSLNELTIRFRTKYTLSTYFKCEECSMTLYKTYFSCRFSMEWNWTFLNGQKIVNLHISHSLIFNKPIFKSFELYEFDSISSFFKLESLLLATCMRIKQQ
jgi:hypothetical protein